MLEKKIKLRKMDLIFTEDEVHQFCHCEYDVIVLEDGVEIARSSDRRRMDVSEAKLMVANASVRPEPKSDEGDVLSEVVLPL